jgi:F420-dependent oxidoreductase-like protein
MAINGRAGGLGLGLSLSGAGSPKGMIDAALAAEEYGFDSVWTSEAWGNDAFTPLAAISALTSRVQLGTAIAQISARTPGATAMTVLTLQELSAGRVRLGLGVSGPQVVEGWHGASFARPLVATREYVAILGSMLAADHRVEFRGSLYSVPYEGSDATGLGKPLRSTMPGHPETPLLLAAIGPHNVALATEIADGLLPYLWRPTRWKEAWGQTITAAPAGFEVAPTVFVSMGTDLDACRDALRPRIALHIGGMGSRDRNFYKDSWRGTATRKKRPPFRIISWAEIARQPRSPSATSSSTTWPWWACWSASTISSRPGRVAQSLP